ncbi:MAG: hypothetical protein IPO22_16795 [Anaerolineales bacterium]|nr:hypothetical protein [Anaerolineales bacterium]
MTIEYDEKGKFYTDVITKLPVSCLIQTATHLMRGFIHVRQGERFKNELERDESFLAVTNVSILGAGDVVLFTAPFMAINRSQIVWVMPSEDEGREALHE